MKLIRIFFIISLFIFSGATVDAQDVIQIEPLFEYPVAPEEMESINDRSSYVVKNFWDNFDFKISGPINQIALNHAFNVYVSPMRWADKKTVDQSIDKLISKISSNPTLLIQFQKAAEENLYGPRAELWIDEIYLKFVDAVLKNKKVPANRKQKLQVQADAIRKTAVGEKAPSFKFKDRTGKEGLYFPMSTPTIIIFGDPENTDWRLARLKMDTNPVLTQTLEKGKLNILFMSMSNDENWANEVNNYSSKWSVGKPENIKEIYDVRMVPSIYLIGSDGKIMLKNIDLSTAILKALELVS